jgi:hypothetical protein
MRFVRFEIANRFCLLNRAAQLILLVGACLMGVWLAQRYLPVVDISSNGRHSLTPETVAYVETLPNPVEIVASLALGDRGSLGQTRVRALAELLDNYAQIGGKVSVRWVDGYRAQTEFGFADPYRLEVRSSRAVEWLLPEDLWERDASSERFMGEKAITSAMAKVSSATQRRILLYADPAKLSDSSALGLSEALEWLKSNATEVDTVDSLPERISGYSLVCLFGSASELTPANLAGLQRAVNEEGMGVWVDLDNRPEQALERFLYYNAVSLSEGRVTIPETAARTPGGDLILEGWGNVPFAERLGQQHQRVLSRGYWWGLIPRSDGLDSEISSILKLSDDSPALALAVRRSSATTSIPARLVVFGSLDWLENDALQFPGNRALAQGCYDWLSHTSILSSIPPRQTELRQLALGREELWKIGLAFSGCVLVPVLVGIVRFITKPR